jgi:hypothetical protein
MLAKNISEEHIVAQKDLLRRQLLAVRVCVILPPLSLQAVASTFTPNAHTPLTRPLPAPS